MSSESGCDLGHDPLFFMNGIENNITEKEVRALRDKVYEEPVSEREWENCKGNWMKPENIAWLQLKAVKPLKITCKNCQQ